MLKKLFNRIRGSRAVPLRDSLHNKRQVLTERPSGNAVPRRNDTTSNDDSFVPVIAAVTASDTSCVSDSGGYSDGGGSCGGSD